jgi:CHAT domain
MAARQYVDFDVLMRQAGDVYEGRVVESPVGETAEVRFVLPFSDLDLERFLLRIGHARRRVRSADSQRLAEIRDFGGALFDAVFRDEIVSCLRRSLDRVEGEDKGLRIRLRLPGNRLTDVPWEFLYDRATGRFLCLSEHTPVVRYIELPESLLRVQVNGPLRMLVVISSPSDYPQLDVEQEWTNVRTAVSGLMSSRRLEIERLEAPTLDELRRTLRRKDFHVLHFIGHGGIDFDSGDGVLVLQDEAGMSRLEPGRDLSTLLYDERSLQLVVLNSCEGARAEGTDPFAGTAQALVRQGVLAVLAMQFEITDEAAIIFGRNFYEALADGLPVDAATNSARKAVFAASRTEWGTPVLYMRAPHGELFRDVRPGPATDSGGVAEGGEPQQRGAAGGEPTTTGPLIPAAAKGSEPAPVGGEPSASGAIETFIGSVKPSEELIADEDKTEAKPKRRARWVLAAVLIAAVAVGLIGYVLTREDGDPGGATSMSEDLVSRVGDICEGRSNSMSGVNDMIDKAVREHDVSEVESSLTSWQQSQEAFINRLYALNLPDSGLSAVGKEEEANQLLLNAAGSSGDTDAILNNLIDAQTRLGDASKLWSDLGVDCTL